MLKLRHGSEQDGRGHALFLLHVCCFEEMTSSIVSCADLPGLDCSCLTEPAHLQSKDALQFETQTRTYSTASARTSAVSGLSARTSWHQPIVLNKIRSPRPKIHHAASVTESVLIGWEAVGPEAWPALLHAAGSLVSLMLQQAQAAAHCTA